MLPAEKGERWVRRIGFLALFLMLAFIIWWIAAFIVRNVRTSLEQRRVLEDARGGGAMMVATTAGRGPA